MISTLNKLFNKLSLKQLLPQISTKTSHFSSNTSCDSDSELDNSFKIERNYEDLNVDSFKELVTDKQTEDKIALILSEYEYEKYATLRVPTTITIIQMKDLLSLDDSGYRKRWLSYLYKRQLARNNSNDKRKKHSEEYWIQKQKSYDQKTNKRRTGIWDDDHQLSYGLWHNTIFSKIGKASINRYYSHRLRTAALFAPKVVIDLDYDKYMKLGECRQLATQIHLLYNWNRYKSTEPFDLHFTNCDPNMPTVQRVRQLLPNIESPGFLADFHQKSYLDLFPKEKLVYLSPDGEQPMKHFNCDDIHIISGFLDKSCHEPISYVKAKKDGIRCMKLPIDENILWGSGNKSLCINHVLQILHDINVTGDWSEALKHNIPQRKQKTIQEMEYEDTLRKQKFNRMKRQNNHKFDPKKANNYF